MLSKMSRDIYEEWYDYWLREPWGTNTNNQLAVIASVLTGKKFDECGGARPPRRPMSNAQAIAMWQAFFGFGKGNNGKEK